jgi:hypothetical protein
MRSEGAKSKGVLPECAAQAPPSRLTISTSVHARIDDEGTKGESEVVSYRRVWPAANPHPMNAHTPPSQTHPTSDGRRRGAKTAAIDLSSGSAGMCVWSPRPCRCREGVLCGWVRGVWERVFPSIYRGTQGSLRVDPTCTAGGYGGGWAARSCSRVHTVRHTEHYPGPTVSGTGAHGDEVTPDVGMTSPPINTLNNSGSSSCVCAAMWFLAQASWVSRSELHSPGNVSPHAEKRYGGLFFPFQFYFLF